MGFIRQQGECIYRYHTLTLNWGQLRVAQPLPSPHPACPTDMLHTVTWLCPHHHHVHAQPRLIRQRAHSFSLLRSVARPLPILTLLNDFLQPLVFIICSQSSHTTLGGAACMAIILLYKFTRTQFSGTNLAAVRKGRRLSSTMSTVKCIYDTQYISGRGSKAMTLLSAVLLRNCELSASRNCTRSSLLYNLVFLMCCEFYFELVRVCNIHKYNYAESLVCLLAVIIYRLYNQAFQIHVRSY